MKLNIALSLFALGAVNAFTPQVNGPTLTALSAIPGSGMYANSRMPVQSGHPPNMAQAPTPVRPAPIAKSPSVTVQGGSLKTWAFNGPPPKVQAPPAPVRPAPIAKTPSVTVQGGSLKTWAFSSPAVERVQVVLKTEGRPLDADVELWAGPDNTPHKMRVYVENGATRPFNAVMETPRGPNTVSVRNIGQLEFPMEAVIEAVSAAGPLGDMSRMDQGPMTIQGG
eukprot:CAMPEP_0194226974 /NCGR_PEP_ID=MMETSP0156-20130528/42619_1 /TAXON_ID=33649 /ORGANISM="Thalassionema nitzschioides, Strain L26-B" /LENGTH=223 /DNA_ID=CAMNT_0038959441 /DNA_START=95 /DNA_END=763 /DNA_ORIENTATION=+